MPRKIAQLRREAMSQEGCMTNQELIARSGDRLDNMVAQNFPQVLIDMEVQHLAKLLAIEASRKVAS